MAASVTQGRHKNSVLDLQSTKQDRTAQYKILTTPMDQESLYEDSCSFVFIDQVALRKTVCDRSAAGLLLQLTIIALRENGDARMYNGKDLSASAWLDITPAARQECVLAAGAVSITLLTGSGNHSRELIVHRI